MYEYGQAEEACLIRSRRGLDLLDLYCLGSPFFEDEFSVHGVCYSPSSHIQAISNTTTYTHQYYTGDSNENVGGEGETSKMCGRQFIHPEIHKPHVTSRDKLFYSTVQNRRSYMIPDPICTPAAGLPHTTSQHVCLA